MIVIVPCERCGQAPCHWDCIWATHEGIKTESGAYVWRRRHDR